MPRIIEVFVTTSGNSFGLQLVPQNPQIISVTGDFVEQGLAPPIYALGTIYAFENLDPGNEVKYTFTEPQPGSLSSITLYRALSGGRPPETPISGAIDIGVSALNVTVKLSQGTATITPQD